MNESRPLDAFPLIGTSSIQELEAALGRIYARPSMEFVGWQRAFYAVQNHLKLRHVGLTYGSYGISARWKFPGADSFAQVFPLGGDAEFRMAGASIAIDRTCSLVVPPATGFGVANSADYERLTLTIAPAALASKLNVILGLYSDVPLKMEPAQVAHQVARGRLKRHLRANVMFFVEQLNSASPLPDVLLAEFEQTLMVMSLYASRHNYSDLLERAPVDVGFAPVRHAEEWVEASWRDAFSLEALAASVNVGIRDLFAKFRRTRGYSPLDFLQRMRLRHARRMLQHPEAAATLAGVAAACGFADHNRFIRDYVRAFGEHPVTTLNRGTGARPTRH
jgi:AraC-like DNA-binding protein